MTKILLADDNRNIREYCRRELEDEGYQVTVARDGNEALELATVETAILLVENTTCIRVSLRSRDAVDVSAVARQFGGGGHRRAAGLRASDDIDTLKTKLISACAAALS